MRTRVSCAGVALLLLTGHAVAETEQRQPAAPVQIIAPSEGGTLLGRRPEFRAAFTGPPPSELLVTLDGTDITPLIERTPQGFTYRPPRALTAGSHQLTVTTKGVDGAETQAMASFSSRHGEAILEAVSQNEIGYVYDLTTARHHYPPGQPTQKLEGILRTDSRVKTDHWHLGFTGALRHLDQNTPLTAPLLRGIDATNWLFTLGYTRDLASAELHFGDILVNETGYTVANLARRGGDVSLTYDRFRLHLFNVAGQQLFGLRGGTGLEATSDRNLAGAAAGIALLEGRLELKGVAATGGEAGSSYSIGTSGGGRKGSVAGGQINSDFFQGKLKSELEGAMSRFDGDRTDAIDFRSDQAWRAKLAGGIDLLTYDAQYEYVGANFTSIGNLAGIPKDRQGLTAHSGLVVGANTLGLTLSRYTDNLDNDPLRSRLVNAQGGVDYAFGGWPTVPVGCSWQRSLQESEREPAGTAPVDLLTDTVSGRVGYLAGEFRIQANVSAARLNDTTATNNDSTTATYQLTPAYGHNQTQLSATLQLTQTWRTLAPRSDQLTTTVDLRSGWLDNRLTGDLASTFTVATRGGANKTLGVNSRIGYGLPEYWGGIKSSLALRGSYNHSYDRTAGAMNRDELALFVVLATTVPVVW